LTPPDSKKFEEPWQAQAFAMAVALSERGLFSWAEWTEALGAEIARAPQRGYYESWLEALESLLVAKGAASRGELAALAEAWRAAAEATPHGQPIVLAGRGGPL
jgi:nitrile hydratase accessory protein